MARSLAVALAAAALLLAPLRAETKDIIVGGEKGWTEAAAPFAPIGADVGDRIIFKFPKGSHAVFAVPDERAWETCERSVFQARAGPQDTPFTFVVPAPGVYYFADPQGQHCENGEKVKVVANAP